MSGALWFFFWDSVDWSPGSGSAAPATTTGSRGSGGYNRLDDDYWRLWAARFNRVDLSPHAPFDLDAQLAALRARLDLAQASASAAAALSAELVLMPSPFLPD